MKSKKLPASLLADLPRHVIDKMAKGGSEWNNGNRRARALRALREYVKEQDGEINCTAVSDLLSDLMHLTASRHIDLEQALDRARVNYECEVVEES